MADNATTRETPVPKKPSFTTDTSNVSSVVRSTRYETTQPSPLRNVTTSGATLLSPDPPTFRAQAPALGATPARGTSSISKSLPSLFRHFKKDRSYQPIHSRPGIPDAWRDDVSSPEGPARIPNSLRDLLSTVLKTGGAGRSDVDLALNTNQISERGLESQGRSSHPEIYKSDVRELLSGIVNHKLRTYNHHAEMLLYRTEKSFSRRRGEDGARQKVRRILKEMERAEKLEVLTMASNLHVRLTGDALLWLHEDWLSAVERNTEEKLKQRQADAIAWNTRLDARLATHAEIRKAQKGPYGSEDPEDSQGLEFFKGPEVKGPEVKARDFGLEISKDPTPVELPAEPPARNPAREGLEVKPLEISKGSAAWKAPADWQVSADSKGSSYSEDPQDRKDSKDPKDSNDQKGSETSKAPEDPLEKHYEDNDMF